MANHPGPPVVINVFSLLHILFGGGGGGGGGGWRQFIGYFKKKYFDASPVIIIFLKLTWVIFFPGIHRWRGRMCEALLHF